jgi:subtilisin family serine protease
MPENPLPPDPREGEETGRQIILLDLGGVDEAAQQFRDLAGMRVASAAEVSPTPGIWEEDVVVVLPELGIAITRAPAERLDAVAAAEGGPIRRPARPERIFEIASPQRGPGREAAREIGVPLDYLRGYQDGIDDLASRLLGTGAAAEIEAAVAEVFLDGDDVTWGLRALGVNESRFTGKGIRVAILDTGYDMNHPDFRDRIADSRSFVDGAPTAQDDHGHGTHCLGTLMGPEKPSQGRRYGIAYNARAFVGKVMAANGKGREGDILWGIDWALQNGCRVVSLSLGKAVPPDADYEVIGRRALDKNCLLIAAAGNDSRRPGRIAPVQTPANVKTVFAVAAINKRLEVALASNGGASQDGGGIDLAAPGVAVYSSKLVERNLFGFDDGTSMATPHVAGVAVLLAEANPDATADKLWSLLTQSARRLALPNTDVGNGLVQAP